MKRNVNYLLIAALCWTGLAAGAAAEPASVAAQRAAGPSAHQISQQIEYQAERPAKKVLFATPHYELILFAFDKGQNLPEHTEPFAAYVQLLEGEGILTLAGREIPLKAGEGFSLPADIPHGIKAPGRFKMLLLKQAGGH
ncbi:MAG: hypothetical protein CVV27_06745 [Candidatus Melainabacteria bacterium HGW-Melainabacteria-1]|nr:MAG: hypothetical protein CVV27_06745 [Candidatus Melainabacteria bacterium HGW-Melainabacteria-1]